MNKSAIMDKSNLCLVDSSRYTRDLRSRIKPFCLLYLEVIWKQPQGSSLCPPAQTLFPVWLCLVSWWFANQLRTAIALRTDLSQMQLPWHSSFERSMARLGIHTPLPPVMCAWRAGKSKRRCKDGACQALEPQTSEWQVGVFPGSTYKYLLISGVLSSSVIIRLEGWKSDVELEKCRGSQNAVQQQGPRNTSTPSCYMSKTSECSEPCLKISLKTLFPLCHEILRLCKHRASSAQRLVPKQRILDSLGLHCCHGCPPPNLQLVRTQGHSNFIPTRLGFTHGLSHVTHE